MTEKHKLNNFEEKYKLIKISDIIENAPYLFTDDFELYGAASKCKGCGGKCYGPSCHSPDSKEIENSPLAKKVIELLDK